MLVRQPLNDEYVKIYSDAGKKIVREKDGCIFSEAVQRVDSTETYQEKD